MSNRNTVQLTLTREALAEAGIHPTAEDVYACLTRRHPSVSKSTVYNNLAKLAEEGAITRVDGLESAARYDMNAAPHYHFQCESCGRVYDVDMPYRQNITDEIDDKHGCSFKNHTILFSGLCADCARAEQAQGGVL